MPGRIYTITIKALSYPPLLETVMTGKELREIITRSKREELFAYADFIDGYLLRRENEMTIKQESGEKREFSTGAQKQAAAGKGTPSLFPGDAYLEVCKHFEDGAELHGGRNWELGIPLSKLIDSLERHIAQEKMGLTDESHARALAWNAVVYLATKIRIQNGLLPKELDDMPKYKVAATVKGHDFVVETANSMFYIYDYITKQYLWRNLTFHKRTFESSKAKENKEGYYSTRELAEEYIEKYLRGNR